MIHFIIGKEKTGKTAYGAAQIAAQMSLEQPILFLVPEQYTVQAEYELLQRTGLPGLMGCEVMSFKRLSHKLLDYYGQGNDALCDETTHKLLLKKIILEQGQMLKYYGKVATFEGFLEEVDVTLKLFQSAGVSPETVNGYIEKIQDESFRLKLTDFARIYEAYHHFMLGGKRLFHDPLMLVMTLEGIMDYFEGKILWVDYFDGFTYLEMLFMSEMAKKAQDFHLIFDVPLDGDKRYEYNRTEYEEIKKLFCDQGLSVEEKVFSKAVLEDEEISFGTRYFMKNHKNPYPKPMTHYYMTEHLNPQEEIHYVAGHIKYLVRTKGYRWKDFTLLCASMTDYIDEINRIFPIYEIPYFLDAKRKIQNHPLAALVMDVLRSIIHGLRQADVLNYLKNPYVDFEPRAKESFESYCIQYGITHGKFQRPFRVPELEPMRETVVGRLESIQKEIWPLLNEGQFEKSMSFIFDLFLVAEKTHEFESYLLENGELEMASLYHQIEENMRYVCQQAEEIFEGEQISSEMFLSLMESLLLNMELGLIPPTLDHVFIGDHDRSKVKENKMVFSIGLNDGKIPLKPSQKSLFDEKEMNFLKTLQMPFFSEPQLELLLSLSKFTKYLRLAKEKHIFSYSAQTAGGEALRPSLYVAQIKEIFPQIASFSWTKEPDFYLDSLRVLRYLTARNFNEKKDENFPLERVISWLNQEAPDFYEKISHYQHYSNVVSQSRGQVAALLAKNKRYSVSQIEQFQSCGYAYFLKYGLKLKDAPQYHYQSVDYGNIMHGILEKFARQVAKEHLSWMDLDQRTIETLLNQKVWPDYFSEAHLHYFGENKRQQFFLKKIEQISMEACRLLVLQVQAGAFRPVAFEQGFGNNKEGTLPIYFKDLEGRHYGLQGKIDRIDLYKDRQETYVRIIDYKSSSKKIDMTKVMAGLQLQIVFYLSEAQKKFESSKPAGALYFEIKEPFVAFQEGMDLAEEKLKSVQLNGLLLRDATGIVAMDEGLLTKKDSVVVKLRLNQDGMPQKSEYVLAPEEMSDLFLHVDHIIQTSVTQIRKAEIDIRPYVYKNEQACTYCPYHSICQFDTSFGNQRRYLFKPLKTKGETDELD